MQWMVPYRGIVLEIGEYVLAYLPEVGKGISESTHRSDRQVENPSCGWASATSQTNIWTEQMEELCTREAYDEQPSTTDHKKTFDQLLKHHRNQKSTTLDIPPAADPLAPPLAVPEVYEDEEEPTEKRADDEEIQGEATRHTDDPWSSELKQRREAHGNTRGHFREETVDDEVINREA